MPAGAKFPRQYNSSIVERLDTNSKRRKLEAYNPYIFFAMKYYYQKPDLYSPIYGERIELDHPVYKFGTLYSKDDIGIIVVQKRFDCKYCYWDSIDPWLANDIYINPHFPIYFERNATIERPIIEVRKLMWALRMKPLPKQYWENYI